MIPTILARPYLSAITPPNGAIIKKSMVVTPSTKPNIFAEPLGKAKIPKASAIGPMPLPKLEINRATNSRLTNGFAKTSKVFNLLYNLFSSCN